MNQPHSVEVNLKLKYKMANSVKFKRFYFLAAFGQFNGFDMRSPTNFVLMYGSIPAILLLSFQFGWWWVVMEDVGEGSH